MENPVTQHSLIPIMIQSTSDSVSIIEPFLTRTAEIVNA